MIGPCIPSTVPIASAREDAAFGRGCTLSGLLRFPISTFYWYYLYDLSWAKKRPKNRKQKNSLPPQPPSAGFPNLQPAYRETTPVGCHTPNHASRMSSSQAITIHSFWTGLHASRLNPPHLPRAAMEGGEGKRRRRPRSDTGGATEQSASSSSEREAEAEGEGEARTGGHGRSRIRPLHRANNKHQRSVHNLFLVASSCCLCLLLVTAARWAGVRAAEPPG